MWSGKIKINLMTDAPKHNLALMKISTYHKAKGDDVYLNMPLMIPDYTYASYLFESTPKVFADLEGGAAIEGSCLPDEFESCKPDYRLFNLNYSLGYTYRPCYRGCSFCKVGKMKHPDNEHHSIWEFHDEQFDTICLLNNNTFFDKQWADTFGEIWEAGLNVKDENGYDLRLLDDNKAEALRKTKWDGGIHFAFDRIQDAKKVINGLELLKEHKIRNAHIYVLIGYDTTIEEDIWRCQVLKDYGQTPYIMPYVPNKQNKAFKRFIDSFMWRKYPLVKQALRNYDRFNFGV